VIGGSATGPSSPSPSIPSKSGKGAVALPPMTLGEEIVADYTALRLTLRAHPMALIRPRLEALAARKS
ncbi:MAG TPA: hypothetical protein VM422_14665, partial [Amaricoccus sp.]|nr:hypothetical protein [Amaricoccus sp.]